MSVETLVSKNATSLPTAYAGARDGDDWDGFQVWKLEDGESVIRLRTGTLRKRADGYRSDLPHAGHWGERLDYVLVPCRTVRSLHQRVTSLLRQFPGLTDRSSDIEALLLGSPELIRQIITRGPEWCRALRRPRLSEAERARRRALAADVLNPVAP